MNSIKLPYQYYKNPKHKLNKPFGCSVFYDETNNIHYLYINDNLIYRQYTDIDNTKSYLNDYLSIQIEDAIFILSYDFIVYENVLSNIYDAKFTCKYDLSINTRLILSIINYNIHKRQYIYVTNSKDNNDIALFCKFTHKDNKNIFIPIGYSDNKLNIEGYSINKKGDINKIVMGIFAFCGKYNIDNYTFISFDVYYKLCDLTNTLFKLNITSYRDISLSDLIFKD